MKRLLLSLVEAAGGYRAVIALPELDPSALRRVMALVHLQVVIEG